MSRIRSKDTVAEKIVFAYLRKEGIYFQKHYPRAPGKPDIALPRKKKAVFIDGDFWHGKDYHRILNTRPKDDYWVLKIARNIQRDKEQEYSLKNMGWEFIRVWEKDLKRKRTQQEVLLIIGEFLRGVQ